MPIEVFDSFFHVHYCLNTHFSLLFLMISRVESRSYLPHLSHCVIVVLGLKFYDTPLPLKAAVRPVVVEVMNIYKEGN